jgi:RNA polymerase sigma factor (sigma-70 family)
MRGERLQLLIHQLGGARGQASNLDDVDLLHRFAAEGDEAAFEVLVWRHGAMVLGVCERVLGRGADADDAFQAVFLTLVRKAGSVRDGGALAGWLFRVARRIAVAARAERARRHGRERPAPDDLAAPDSGTPDDLRPVLDEEVRRLPEKLRRVVVLCYLEGRTTEEAAAALGCPRGTVLSRLAAARERLRGRLRRRGVVPASVLAALAGLAALAEATPPPAALVRTALRAAGALAGGNPAAIPPRVFALYQGVFQAMLWMKIKIAIAVVVLLGFTGGTAWMVHAVGATGDEVALAEPPKDDKAPADAPKGDNPKRASAEGEQAEPPLPRVQTRGGPAGPESFDQAIEWLRGNQLQQLIAIGSLAKAEPYAPRRAEVAAELEKLLNGNDRLVALESTKALYPWATKAQVPSLLKALDDPNVFVREGAIEALGPLQDERAVAPVAKFLASTFEREVAGRSLIRMGAISEKEVRKYLTDADGKARDEAARVLRQIGKVGKDDDFAAALGALQDGNAFNRRKGLRWFASADPDHPRRAEAAQEISRLLKDGDVFDKQDAAKALTRWATRKEVPVLIDVLKQENLGLGVKPAVMRALGRLKDDRAIPALAEMLASPFESNEAVAALAAVGPLAEGEVLKYLGHERYTARVAACKVLKEIGTMKSLIPLQETRSEAETQMYGGFRDVSAAAKAALDVIQSRQ